MLHAIRYGGDPGGVCSRVVDLCQRAAAGDEPTRDEWARAEAAEAAEAAAEAAEAAARAAEAAEAAEAAAWAAEAEAREAWAAEAWRRAAAEQLVALVHRAPNKETP